jgi:hypothetical protein
MVISVGVGEIIIAFIELIISGKQEFREINRKFVEEFLDPVFSRFKSVHENYLQTFRDYRNRIQDNQELYLNEIIQKIREDSLFSRDLRSDLMESLKIENKKFSSFIDSIENYLLYPWETLDIGISRGANYPRISLIEALERIESLDPSTVKKANIIDLVNWSIDPPKQQNQEDIPKQVTEYYLSPTFIVDEFTGFGGIRPFRNISSNSDQIDDTLCKEIKRYLATRCVDFIVEAIQYKYKLVTKQYWKIKFEAIGLKYSNVD